MKPDAFTVLQSLAVNFPELFSGEELSGSDAVDRLNALADAVSGSGVVVFQWSLQGSSYSPTPNDYEILRQAIENLGSSLQAGEDIEDEMRRIGVCLGYPENWMEKIYAVPTPAVYPIEESSRMDLVGLPESKSSDYYDTHDKPQS